MIFNLLKLYGQVFRLGLQNTLVYRWNFLIRIVAGFIPLLGSVYLWGAVFQEEKTFGPYDYRAMISYFILLIVVDVLTSPTEDDFQIASDIKDGLINQVLLKPLNYFGYRVMLFASSRMMYAAVTFLPLAIAFYFLRRFLEAVPIAETWLPTLAALIGSALLQFGISYATAMLAFWLLEIGSVTFILFSIEYLAGGHIFPLDILPPLWSRICLALPFAYEYYFPAAVCLGRFHGAALLGGFLHQWFWILFFWLIGQLLWRNGLRKYTAVGG